MPQNNHDEIACVFRCIRSPVRGRLRSVDDSLASALEGIAQIRQSCIETLLRDVLSEYGPCHRQARNGSDSRGACCDLGACAPALLFIRSRSSGGSGWSGCRSSHDHVFERRNRHKHRLAILASLGTSTWISWVLSLGCGTDIVVPLLPGGTLMHIVGPGLVTGAEGGFSLWGGRISRDFPVVAFFCVMPLKLTS